MARGLLTLTGLLYVGLGLWCSLAPADTSARVGLQRVGAAGQSEFLVVYGGLEVGLGLLFLRPLWRPAALDATLWACVAIHGCLVLFRTVSFGLYGAEGMARSLAVGEWIIFLAAAGCYFGSWWASQRAASSAQ